MAIAGHCDRFHGAVLDCHTFRGGLKSAKRCFRILKTNKVIPLFCYICKAHLRHDVAYVVDALSDGFSISRDGDRSLC